MSSSEEQTVPEGYESTQLGPKTRQIPLHWDVRKLGTIANINMGSSPKSEYYNEQGEGLPFFQGNADFGTQHPQVTVWCTNPNKTAEKEDLLLSVRAPVGDLNIADQKCCIGRGLAAISGKEVDNGFLYYLLSFERPRLETYAQGSTFKSVNSGVLNNFPIQFPPLPEQRRIAGILSTVDKQIQQTDEVIEETKELKRGVMQDILVSGMEKGRDTQEVSLGPKALEIPSSWTVSTIDELTDKVTDGTHNSPETQESGRPYLTSKNIREWGFDLSDLKYVSEEDFLQINSRSKPQHGDVLYVKDGANTGIAQVNTLDFEFCLLSSIALIRPNDELSAEFLQQQLSWSLFKQVMASRMSGTGIKRLTIEKIKKSKIIQPPLDEQQKIASLLGNIDDKITKERETKQSLKELKRGLMQDLLSGKVRVNTD